ncbi:ATP-binding cassette subfamily B protein [Mycoplasma testudineum]|uniref:ATP-binding cassette subfamily B protein n=1 Tax=Mycoplasma testudineum TaxID=244584 RepID=A0A4R6IGG7_9MOLU|nr:ABC transporter ATP-binding protein [Mycoplasma testudineum]TDO21164.1 ATP-binding cassette subfamily B protein [Mycoplasma testudineum]
MLKKVFLKKQPNFLNGFNFIWRYLKNFKKASIFVVVVTIIIALINVGAIVALFLLMQLVAQANQNNNIATQVIIYSAVLLGAYLVILVLSIIRNWIVVVVSTDVAHLMRSDLFIKLKLLKIIYYDQTPSGDLLSRVSNDMENIIRFLSNNISQIIGDVTQMLVMAIAMFVFSPQISAIVIFGFLPISLVIIIFIARISRKRYTDRQTSLGEMNGFLEETISAARTIKTLGAEEILQNKFNDLATKQKKNDVKALINSYWVLSWNLFSGDLMNLVVIVFPVIFAVNNIHFGGINTTLNASGTTNIGAAYSVLTVFTLLSRNFSGPMFQIFNNINVLQNSIAGLKRVMNIFEQENEANESEKYDLQNIRGDILIKDLTFSYDGNKNVLHGINLHVKYGEVVAIVGPTGSGKTTFINLLTKFYDIENGYIFIDGVDIRKITKESMRKNVSLVLQDNFLFNETVLENIRNGNLKATDEDVYAAAKAAHAHEMILRLEDGYKTVLDDTKITLSTGEKQLISIARAILKNSTLLILDEATSNIDSETESLIQKALLKLQENKTSFIIAHRLSTIRNADKIVVLKDGKIIEVGTHDQLLKLDGFYAKMSKSGKEDADLFV